MKIEMNDDETGAGGAAPGIVPPRAGSRPLESSGRAAASGVTARPRLALFDLDHTLIPMDSDYEWGEFTIAMGWCDATEFKRRNTEFFEQYRAGVLDVHAYVRFATQAIREQGAEKSSAAHDRFMAEVVHKAITPQALALIEQHRAAGDELVIVTATNEFVTRPIAQAFGVAELIAVELERDDQGRLTGEIKGTPSAREGKVIRMEQWLAARGLSWEAVDTTFYTDSMNDLALLEKATWPVATNPDERLRALALARGWRILDLF